MDGPKQPNPQPQQNAATIVAKAKRKKSSGGVKETIESILIAFILAFVFRAFVVEAFVIPTGSMATTLMGAHMKFTCTDCGHPWRVNYNAAPVGDDLYIPPRAWVDVRDSRGNLIRIDDRVYHLVCENCAYRVPRDNRADPDNSATAPPIDYGDRILVLKYLYQFTDPKRWDVVVFKSPADPKYQTNYIKRLVGKPSEQVMVLDGDIYIGRPGDPVAKFTVQSKPHHAQEALWRVVYNNDFQPRRTSWNNPWMQQLGGNGWTTGSSTPGDRAMRFDNLTGSSKLNFNPPGDAPNQPLTNWMAYNMTMWQDAVDSYDRPQPVDPLAPHVSDLKLQLFYQRHAGTGPLRLELTKNGDAFVAEFLPDKIRLLRINDSKETEIAAKPWNPPGRPAEIEFTNVDYRVAVRVDGEDLIVTTPQQYAPNVEALIADHKAAQRNQRPRISISADRQQATLQHVSLWRDVFYTNRGRGITWGTPDKPMVLGKDEFFTLGDNSSNSLDARFWSDRINLKYEELDVESGRVPARFMLGKAFFVYWPAGLNLFGKWGLVPNVGEMRFIH
jgi:signal peptidase I